MCILSYLPAGVELTDQGQDDLWSGGILNSDGHGWAIAAGDFMLMGKSLELEQALKEFSDYRKKYPQYPAIFHSRYATHGSVRVDNVHPFMVGGSHQTVLAHNGILPKDAWPDLADDRSDTKILAEDLLPRRWFRLDRPSVRANMTQWAGTYNKVIILTVNPRYRQNAYIINEKKGVWDTGLNGTGMWHSNHDYLGKPRWYKSYGTAYSWPAAKTATVGHRKQADLDLDPRVDSVIRESDLLTAQEVVEQMEAQEMLMLEAGTSTAYAAIEEDRCNLCSSEVDMYQICKTCGTCNDCAERVENCQCYGWKYAGC